MQRCRRCEAGTYLPAGDANRTRCLKASTGHYVPGPAAVRELPCPQGMLAEGTGSSGCARCPVGADCETSSHFRSLAIPRSSYFRTPTRSIARCVVHAACHGWDATSQRNLCAPGATGYLCQGCLDGWWRPHDQPHAPCRKCTWTSVLQPLLTSGLVCGAIGLLGALSVDAALWGSMHAVILRLALNFFTAASVFSRIHAWELEGALGQDLAQFMATGLGVVFGFNGGVPAHLLGLECLSPGTDQWRATRTRALLWVLMPLLWLFGMALLSLLVFEAHTWQLMLRRMMRKDVFKRDSWAVARRAARSEFMNEPRLLGLFRTRAVRCKPCDRFRIVLADSAALAVIGYFILLPTVLSSLVPLLACGQVGEEGSKWRLLIAPDVRCFRAAHLPWSVVALGGVLLWGLLVPSLLAFYLWFRRDSLASDIQLKARVVWLSDGYEPRFLFWEGVVQLRRTLIVLVAAWPGLSRHKEMAFYQVIGISALLLHFGCKPFDNRAGELLDHAELHGLCAFLALVTSMQLVLLTDPAGLHDLLPVLLCALLLTAMSFLSSPAGWRLYLGVASALLLTVLLVMEWLGGAGADGSRLARFLLLASAAAASVLHVLWLLLRAAGQVWGATAEAMARARSSRARPAEAMGPQAPKEAWQIAASTKHMLAATLPFGALLPKPALPDLSGRGWRARLGSFIIDSHSESRGGLINYDPDMDELVLGLHPDTCMSDAGISSYSRKRLARLGPFLTDEERRFVAMSIKDALMHLIVDCDTNVIHCSLLELLVRAAFAWCYQQAVSQPDAVDAKVLRRPDVPRTPPSLAIEDTSAPAKNSEAGAEVNDFADLLFDGRIFKAGITAADFQAQLQRLTAMSRNEVNGLLEAFLEARQRHELNRA